MYDAAKFDWYNDSNVPSQDRCSTCSVSAYDESKAIRQVLTKSTPSPKRLELTASKTTNKWDSDTISQDQCKYSLKSAVSPKRLELPDSKTINSGISHTIFQD